MSATGPLVVMGDALLDWDIDGQVSRLCPDAPAPVLENPMPAWRPGGAALAALLAAAEDVPVVLVAPLGDDEASATVRVLLEPHVTVISLPLTGPLAEKTRFRTGGRTLLRVDRGDGRAGLVSGAVGARAAEAIAAAGAVLVADYGRGTTADDHLRSALARRAARVPLVWDPHPKGAGPVPRTRLATPNHVEAVAAAGAPAAPEGTGGQRLRSATAARPRSWPGAGRRTAVAVTLGDGGAVLVQGDSGPLVVPARPLAVTDTCGAGRPLRRRGCGGPRARRPALGSGDRGDRGRHVLPRGRRRRLLHGPYPDRRGDPVPARHRAGRRPKPPAGAAELARRIRAAGGTVVATGGCFDLLHAGHVSLLQAARTLGDCLIVCLNSDASVRRLKGDGRPAEPRGRPDRPALRAGLRGRGAVFVEDTPCAVLDQIRPDIWVKGGDYDGHDLPEAALLENWGGTAVTVPYLSGRSTTRLQAAALADELLTMAPRSCCCEPWAWATS